jgi:hypothetical protein
MAALAVLGGLILAAVIAHGAWSARKASPRQAETVDLPERVEPVLGVPPAGTGTESTGLAPDTLNELKSVLPRRPSARLDPLIDAIAPITLEAPVSGELALTHLPPSRRAGTKPFLIEGLNAESGDWELPSLGQRYSEFQAGVQMANRAGGLNQIEFSEFVQKLQQFGEGVGGMVEVPDMFEVVNRAREIDAFAGEHDAQLAVTLRANGAAWSVGYLQQTAGRRGFVPGVLPGRLVLPSAEEGAPPVLVLSFDAQAALAEDPHIAAVRQVTLSLDVPQTPEAAEPFPAWHEAARNLAADMDATMVDDQGRLITLHAFAAIGEDLKTLYRALEAQELTAGSTAARRLFS